MEYMWIAVWPITHIFIDEAIQPEMSLIAEEDFSIKIRVIFKLLLSPIHQHRILLVVKRLQILRQDQAKIISQNSPQWRHRDAKRLRTTVERHIWVFFKGHFFVSVARQHFVLCLWIQIFPLDAQLFICQDDYYDHKLDVALLTLRPLTPNFDSKFL